MRKVDKSEASNFMVASFLRIFTGLINLLNATIYVDAFGNPEMVMGLEASNGGVTNLTYFPSLKLVNLQLEF